MFSSFIWIYIIPIMMISPFLTISMNSWFSIWMTLELNLMTFIPMIIFFNKHYKELSMKYFIIQSFSSSILLMTSNFFMINMNNNFKFLQIMNYLINISLLIKLGAPPFHSWFINMMNNLIWSNCFILSTWQKISPMILIMYNYSMNLIYFTIILSSLMGSLYGINHQSIRLIMGYSSINHISWMLLNLLINENTWMLYFSSYFILNLSIMIMLNNLKIYFINQMFLINSNLNKFFMFFNFMSIAGLPPLFGFLMKWHSMYMFNKSLNLFMLLIMIFMSLFTFYYYTRLIISMMMTFKLENKLIIMNKMFYSIKLNFYKMFWITMFINLWIMNNWIF